MLSSSITRFALIVATALTACAEGGQSDESAANAQKPLVKCDGSRLPTNGDRCDTATTPADAYCRTNDCRMQCEDECRCNRDGRWECFVFCRDSYGCGTLPLCGVGCGGTDAGTTGG